MSAVGGLVGFATLLRAAGVDATVDRVQAMTGALATLGATGERDLYWAGRLTLCGSPDDLDRYDRVFAALFDATGLALPSAPRPGHKAELRSLRATREPSDDGDQRPRDLDTALRQTASDVEVLRAR